MKTFLSFYPLLAASAFAQQQPALLVNPPDGTEPKQPEVRYVFPPAQVLETTVHRQGGRDVIIQRLALDPGDPVIPVKSPEVSAVQNLDPQEDSSAFTPPSFLLMLSATVYPGPRTYLSWTHHFPDGTVKNYSGWSNLDWNHLSCIATFIATDGEAHSFVMGIGTEQEPAENAPEFTTTVPPSFRIRKAFPLKLSSPLIPSTSSTRWKRKNLSLPTRVLNVPTLLKPLNSSPIRHSRKILSSAIASRRRPSLQKEEQSEALSHSLFSDFWSLDSGFSKRSRFDR